MTGAESTDLETPTARQLYDALVAASDNVMVQLGLIYVLADRIGASQRDCNVVRERIVGGPVRECRG